MSELLIYSAMRFSQKLFVRSESFGVAQERPAEEWTETQLIVG
ncbi:hypothetical protein MCAMS1_00351 [biofilm metagenome]